MQDNITRQPSVFISRTTAGLAALAEKVAEVLRERGFDIIHQPDFGLEWRRIRHMLMEKVRESDAVVCLVGPAYGFAPRTTFPEFRHPDTGREEYSYTQLEFLMARRLRKPIICILVPEALCTFSTPEDRGTPEQQKLQSDFIRDFIKLDDHVYHGFSTESELLGAFRSKLIPIPDRILPPFSPENIPFRSIGTIFTGRSDTLLQLRESLVSATDTSTTTRNRPAVHVIHGTGGVGKTRLTVEYSHAHGADYTARLFVRGSSPGALDESLASLAGLFILNLEEQDELETEVRMAAVIRWLAGHPEYLLVIDNVDTDDAREHALAILERLPAGHVLITSRLHTWPGDIMRTPLSVLSDEDGRDLLLRYRSSPKAPAPDADDADALALAHDLDGLALALEQAAAHLNVIAITISEYHERWKSNSDRVREWHDPEQMSYPVSVATTWLTSFQQLAPASQALLNLLSWLAPDPIPRFLMRPLVERKLQPDPLNGTDPYKALGELINFSLANPTRSGAAFTVHRLVQEVARERQEPPCPAPELRLVLEWLDAEMPTQTDDVRAWPIAKPLAPHAIVSANLAYLRAIPVPTSRLLNQVGLLLNAQANYRGAEPHFRQALAIDEANLGPDHPEIAVDLNNLAILLQATHRLEDAEALMRRALAIDQATYGADSFKVSRHLSNLATLLVDSNRLEEAESCMRRALVIDEARLDEAPANVARDLNNLGQLLKMTLRIDEAEPLIRRALELDTENFGPDHPIVAVRLSNLASLLKEMKRLEEAEALMRRALAINEASYGDAHPKVALDLNNLSQLLIATGRPMEAEAQLRRALAIDEATFGSDHPKVAIRLSNLAQLEMTADRFAESEPLLRRALAINESAYGSEHPKVARNLTNLASLLKKTGQWDEPERLMRRALAVDEACQGENHPDVAIDFNNLGLLLLETDRKEEAELALRSALMILLTVSHQTGKQHPNLMVVVQNTIGLLKAKGVSEEQAMEKIRELMAPFGISI